jgi:NAD(P)-dependent dehydrogenase (short-subunit alcohol dehydrogenase family)
MIWNIILIMQLKDETAIITGSTSGIGKKLAEIFLNEWCKVTICSRSEEKVKNTLTELKEKYGNSVIGTTCDVSKPEDVKNLVDLTLKEFGSIRILVANAGLNLKYGPFEYMTPEMVNSDAIKVLGANLIGTMNSISAVIPQMIKQKYGRIVTLSGGGASRALTNMALYSASKGGIDTFSKCFAQELKERDDDIKINIFNPGMLKTNLATNIGIVPGWRNEDSVKEESELAFKYLGGDIEKSCSKVIPFVLPTCTKNGTKFTGVSVMNMIRGGIKLKKVLKELRND